MEKGEMYFCLLVKSTQRFQKIVVPNVHNSLETWIFFFMGSILVLGKYYRKYFC